MDVARGARTGLAIATAAAPLAGVVWGGWSVREVLLLYWVENLVIGGWQWVKIATARGPTGRPSGLASRVSLLVFFTVHYGMFCGVHGVFILHLASMGATSELGFLLPGSAYLAIAAMVISHGVETWQSYFATGDYRTADPRKLMSEPYRHIVVIHVAIIAGGFAAVAFRETIIVLVLIVLGKLLIDLRAIWKKPESPGDSVATSAGGAES